MNLCDRQKSIVNYGSMVEGKTVTKWAIQKKEKRNRI